SYRSTDLGVTWVKMSAGFALPVTEDPQGRLFRPRMGGVDESSDDGDTWLQSSDYQTLPMWNKYGPLGVNAAGALFVSAFDPGFFTQGKRTNPAGWSMFASSDGGHEWVPLPPLQHPVVRSFAVDKRGRLLVATNGGVYRLE